MTEDAAAAAAPAETAPFLAGNAGLNPQLDRKLLGLCEDAGLNASAPPQQVWIDGWVVRFSPGKAKRARCVNALSAGRRSVAHKLERAQAVFDAAQLPLLVRITPFTRPVALDEILADMGFTTLDDTRVMVVPRLNHIAAPDAPPGMRWETLGHVAMAQYVGAMRGSPLAQRQAHAERLAAAPVPFSAIALKRLADGEVVACAQSAREGGVVGLYDVFVDESLRRQGLGTMLCTRLLADARKAGAVSAYLQVEAENHAARTVYARLGFVDGYGYHYRAR